MTAEAQRRQNMQSLMDLKDSILAAMSQCKVTNAVTQKDPPMAALSLAQLVHQKFPKRDIQTVLDDLVHGVDTVWPTAGLFIGLVKDAHLTRTRAARTPKTGEIVDFRNLGGYRFDEVMASQEGRRALRKGKPHTFLRKVISKEIPVETLSFADN